MKTILAFLIGGCIGYIIAARHSIAYHCTIRALASKLEELARRNNENYI